MSANGSRPHDSTPSVVFRRACAPDASALAELGLRTFLETFAAQNRPEDIHAYVTRAYGEEQQRRELEDPSCTVLVGEAQDEAVAYALLRRGLSPTCVISDAPIEISRFYVSKEL